MRACSLTVISDFIVHTNVFIDPILGLE